jgi:hypothetical protein
MSTFNTNFVFSSGKLTVALDGGAGSSGKGKLGSFLCEHANNWQFACNTFMPQAGHWVMLDDGREFFYQTFNSCAYLANRYEKLYIGPGATIELPAFWKEIEKNSIPHHKIGISPLSAAHRQGLRARHLRFRRQGSRTPRGWRPACRHGQHRPRLRRESGAPRASARVWPIRS